MMSGPLGNGYRSALFRQNRPSAGAFPGVCDTMRERTVHNKEEGQPMQYKRISADCHLDLPWLPPELFVSEAKRELRDRMPYVEDGPDGPHWATKSGINMGLLGGVGSVGGKFIHGQNYRVDKM